MKRLLRIIRAWLRREADPETPGSMPPYPFFSWDEFPESEQPEWYRRQQREREGPTESPDV